MGTSSNSKILRISEMKKTEKTPPQKHLRDQQDGRSSKLRVQIPASDESPEPWFHMSCKSN